jgi:hypothetical protein
MAQNMDLQHTLSWVHSVTVLNWTDPQLLAISCCHTEDVILVYSYPELSKGFHYWPVFLW